MKKLIIVILIIFFAVGAISFIFFAVNYVEEYRTEKTDELKVGDLVKDFMEEAYIKENYKQAASFYIPPDGFETFLSDDPISVEEYIEWYVRSVDLKS